MRCKGGDHGSHQKLHHSGSAGGANKKLNGVQSLVICYNNCIFLLARSLAPWRYGSSNMAHNGKNSEIWPKWPALMIPYLHGHGRHPSNQRCYGCMGLRSQYICHLPTLIVAFSYFPPWRESDTQMGQNGHIAPNLVTHNSPFKRRGHMGKHPIRCGFMCPLRITLTLGQVAHATSGRTLRGRRGFWQFWAKRLKFTQEWSLEKSYLRITREVSLGLLHGCKPKLCFPFAIRLGVQSIMEAF